MNVGNIGSSSIEQFISNQRPPLRSEGARSSAVGRRQQASEARSARPPPPRKDIPAFDPERRIGAYIDVTA